MPELGFLLACSADFAFAEGFGPGVRLTRTQTIMQGASHCGLSIHTAAREGVRRIFGIVVSPLLLACCLVIVPAMALYRRRQLGGIIGDCLGASVEATETALIVALAMS